MIQIKSLATPALLSAVSPLLFACAILPAAPRPPAGPIFAVVGSRVSLPGDPAGDPAVTAAERAVREALVQRGYSLTVDAPYQVEVALARRAAAVGFGAASTDSPDVDAKPQDGGIDLCRDHIFRLSVAILDQRTAVIASRGAAERVRCGNPDADDLTELAAVALGSLR